MNRIVLALAVTLTLALGLGSVSASPAAQQAAGTFLFKFGSLGTGDGQFDSPWGVAVDAAGNVYVADYSNHRIQKFTSTGTFLAKWGSLGSGDGQFSSPIGVAMDASGNGLRGG